MTVPWERLTDHRSTFPRVGIASRCLDAHAKPSATCRAWKSPGCAGRRSILRSPAQPGHGGGGSRTRVPWRFSPNVYVCIRSIWISSPQPRPAGSVA